MIDPIRLGAPGPHALPGPLPLAHRVLRLIWEQQAISRADIARRLDLSRSTVSDIVSALLDSGLVRESGTGESRGGRRPIVLTFHDEAFALVGVDLATTAVSVVVTDLRGRVRARRDVAHPVAVDPEGTRALLPPTIEATLRDAGIGRDRLLGIGIAVPSPVDPRHPERLHPIALPAWRGRHGLEALMERFRVPVLIDNDANLGALAERWWGAARGIDDFTFIMLATGVGSGHMMGGRIYRGGAGVAGEIGHLTIDPHGPPCNCGNRGCLGTFVGADALVARARELAPRHPGTRLRGAALTSRAIEDAALAGDPLAVQVMHEAAEHLGIAVAGVLNLLNPRAVIIGGGLARLEEQLLQPMRETVMRRTFVSAVASASIRSSTLGPLGVALGAATLVLDAALNDPTLFPAIEAVEHRARSASA